MKKFNLKNFAFIFLIIIEFILLLIVNFSNSMTFDEIVYAPAGLSYLEKRDFRLNVEHPPLSKYLLALPLYLSGIKGSYENQYWEVPNQIQFGKNFYFKEGKLSKLNISRFVSIFTTLIFLISFYLFAKNVFGNTEAILSTLFFIFYPDFSAHGTLATTDIYFSFFFFLSFIFFYFYVNKLEKKYLFLTSVFTALSILTRHSGLFLIPFYLIILTIYILKRKISIKKTIVFILIIFLILYISIWTFYLFENKIFLKNKLISSNFLPSAYINSLLISKDLISKRLSFFLGEICTRPPKTFYILSFLLKTPISILIILLLSFFLKILKRIRYFWASFLIFFIFSSIFAPAFSHRYLLFLYPILFLISGVSARELLKKRWDKIFLFFLIIFNVFSYFRFFPYPLSYVNEFIKKENALFYFADSNLDWGQGLIALKKYCEKEKIDEIYLSYFGTANPYLYGIKYFPLPSYHQELYWKEFYTNEIIIKKDKKVGLSITNIVGLYQPAYFGELVDLKKPEKIIGGSIYIYTSKKDMKFVSQKDSAIRWTKEENFVLK